MHNDVLCVQHKFINIAYKLIIAASCTYHRLFNGHRLLQIHVDCSVACLLLLRSIPGLFIHIPRGHMCCSAFAMTAEHDCRDMLLLRKRVNLCLNVSYPMYSSEN